MDDYYPGAVDDEQRNLPPDGEQAEPKPEGEEPEGESMTALLPKSLFGDVKPGDSVSVKVVRVFKDDVEVEPVESGETKPEPEYAGEIQALATED